MRPFIFHWLPGFRPFFPPNVLHWLVGFHFSSLRSSLFSGFYSRMKNYFFIVIWLRFFVSFLVGISFLLILPHFCQLNFVGLISRKSKRQWTTNPITFSSLSENLWMHILINTINNLVMSQIENTNVKFVFSDPNMYYME